MLPQPSPQHEVNLLLTDVYPPWAEIHGRNPAEFSVHMRGYARIGDRYHFDQELAHEVYVRCASADADASVASLRQLIPNLDGGWALIAKWSGGRTLAATDRMRTIPLFWAEKDGQFFISDDGFLCASAVDQRDVHELAALEFVVVGYVTGSETLFSRVRQLRSGEILSFEPGNAQSRFSLKRYYRFYPTHKSDAREEDLEEELASILDETFRTFSASLHGETIAVPLSGGLDSRLVAGMLKRHGVENVICFTYGDSRSEEVRISEQVAQALRYRWECVPYDGPLWQYCRENASVSAYGRYACKSCSKPHRQDFPAVLQLINNGNVDPSKTVFFPGHSGDMIGGSHLPQGFRKLEVRPQLLVQQIWNHNFRIWPIRPSFRRSLLSGIREKIERLSAKPDHQPIESACAQYEMWDAENRQALYIINSVRTYEFFGARWRTMWDYPLMDFFLTVPLHLRFGERLYVNTIRDHLFRGPMRDLAVIPIAGKGDWTGRDGLKKQIRIGTNLQRSVYQLLRACRQLINSRPVTISARSRAMGPWLDPYLRLYGYGFTPQTTRIRDVFEETGLAEWFPPLVKEFLEAYSDFRPHEVSYLGLSSALELGEILKSIHARQGHA